MDGLGIRARAGVAGLVVLSLLGVAGCSGDDGDASTGSGGVANQDDGGDSNGAGSADTAEGNVCSLLEVSEIEAEFGDRGVVGAGEENTEIACNWEVGDLSEPNSGSGNVGVMRARYAGTVESALAESRAIADNPIDIEGLGDEAYMDVATLYVRSGEALIAISAFFSPSVDGLQEKLVTLAQHVLTRL